LAAWLDCHEMSLHHVSLAESTRCILAWATQPDFTSDTGIPALIHRFECSPVDHQARYRLLKHWSPVWWPTRDTLNTGHRVASRRNIISYWKQTVLRTGRSLYESAALPLISLGKPWFHLRYLALDLSAPVYFPFNTFRFKTDFTLSLRHVWIALGWFLGRRSRALRLYYSIRVSV